MEQIKVKDREISDLHELLNHEQQLLMMAQNKIALLEQKQAESEASQVHENQSEDHRQADPEPAENQNTVEQSEPVQSQPPKEKEAEKEPEYNLFEPEKTSIFERVKKFFKDKGGN